MTICYITAHGNKERLSVTILSLPHYLHSPIVWIQGSRDAFNK